MKILEIILSVCIIAIIGLSIKVITEHFGPKKKMKKNNLVEREQSERIEELKKQKEDLNNLKKLKKILDRVDSIYKKD